MLDLDAGHDQDQRAVPMAVKPAAARADVDSAPASPGACSSLSSAGPSLFTGSPMGSTPQQGSKGDVSIRGGAGADDQQQQFKWSENPMLSTASPAASLSTPNSGAGLFHTLASVSQLQRGDKFFTPYNNSAFNDANVGSSDQFYTPVEQGLLRAMQRAGCPSAGRQASCRSPTASQHLPHQRSGCAGGAGAEAPHESAQGAQSAVSLRSISNVGSPASPREVSSRVHGDALDQQQGAQSAVSLRSISNVGSPASQRECSSRAQGEALRSISNVGSPLNDGARDGEQQYGDDGSVSGDGGISGEDVALSPAGSTCAGDRGACVPAADAEHQVEGAAAAAADGDGDYGDLNPAGQLQAATPGSVPWAQAQLEFPDSPVAQQRAHSTCISPSATSQQGGMLEHFHEEGLQSDAAPLLSAAEGGIQGAEVLALEQQQQQQPEQQDLAAKEGLAQAGQDHGVEVGQDHAVEEGQGENEEAAETKGHDVQAGEGLAQAAEESQGQGKQAAVEEKMGAKEVWVEESADALKGAAPVGTGAEGLCAAELGVEEAAAAAAVTATTAAAGDAADALQAGKGPALGHANRTASPTRHDPRVFAANLSSKGRQQGRWAAGHAHHPTPPPPTPQHHPPKPNTTAIPDHLLKATHLVLRTNRPEPDPVSARRLKMTVPKTPVLATAQRLGSHPLVQQFPGPSSAVPAPPSNRPRRASYTNTPTRTQSAGEQAAVDLSAPGGKPRRASYTPTPTPPPSTAPTVTHAPPAPPPPAPPAEPQHGSQGNEAAAAAHADNDAAEDAGPAASAASVAETLASTPTKSAGSAGAAGVTDTCSAAAVDMCTNAAAVPKAAGIVSMAARGCARASAAAAAAAAARAKAQQASPLRKGTVGTGAQPKPTSQNPEQAAGVKEAQPGPVPQNAKQAAREAPGSGNASHNNISGLDSRAAAATATPPKARSYNASAAPADKDAQQAKQGSVSAGPGQKTAPTGAAAAAAAAVHTSTTATPPKAQPPSAAALAKKASGATAVLTHPRPRSATATTTCGRTCTAGGAAGTPPKPQGSNATPPAPEQAKAQRAAVTPPPRAQQQRSASVAPQPRGVDRKAWPGLPPTRAQQRSASVTQARRPSATASTAAATSKAQRPATSPAPTATPPKTSAAHGAAVAEFQRPAKSPAPTATPPKAANSAAEVTKVPRPSTSPAPTNTPTKPSAAQGAAAAKVQRPSTSPAPTAIPPKTLAVPAAVPTVQQPALAQGANSKGRRSAAPLPAAATGTKTGSKPGTATSTAGKAVAPPAAAAAAAPANAQKKPGAATSTASKATAPPAPPTAAAAAPAAAQKKPGAATSMASKAATPPAPPTADPAVTQKKPAVPKLGRRPHPSSAPTPTPAPAPPAPPLEPLPSFFKKPGVPRLSAKAKHATTGTAAARTHKHADAGAEKDQAHKHTTATAEKALSAERIAQQAQAVEQARMQAEAAAREGEVKTAQSRQEAEAARVQQDREAQASAQTAQTMCAQEGPTREAEAVAEKEGEASVVRAEENSAEENTAKAATAEGASTAAPVFVRPQVPKLNMEAVAAAAARDNEEEEQAIKGFPPFALAPPPSHPPLHTTQHSAGSGVAAAFKAPPPATAPAKPVEAAVAVSEAQQCHQGPPRPTTAPAPAGAGETGKAQKAKAAAAGGPSGTGTEGPAGVGRPRRNSAALPQVRPPGMWSPPPPLRGATNKAQHQAPSKAPAAARGNVQGRARRNSCTAAVTCDTKAAGLPPPSRAAAMAASLQAVKEEGGVARHNKEPPTCNNNNINSSSSNDSASSKVGLSSAHASPAKGLNRMPTGEQQVRVSPINGMTFGTPVDEQKMGNNSTCNRYSSCPGPTEQANKEEAAPSFTPKPREDGPTDLSLAWATTPCTSMNFERALQPAARTSAAGSSVSLNNNSPSGSDGVPQMPSLGAGMGGPGTDLRTPDLLQEGIGGPGSLMPTPFVPAAAPPVAPLLHNSLSSSGGRSSGSGSFSLYACPQFVGLHNAGRDDLQNGGGDGRNTAMLRQQVPQEGASLGQQQQQHSVLDSICRSSSRDEGRHSLGAAAMTPVLMHPFAVATPAPQGMEQETPRLGLQPGRKSLDEDVATPAGLAMLTPAPQLPSAQELEQLVHMQRTQQESQAAAQQQQQAVEQQGEHPTDMHLKANLPASEQFVWDAASYEVSGPNPRPMMYEEWGSPDDSPVHAGTEARDQRQAEELPAKLQVPGAGVNSSLDITAAQANFSFTSEIGALRMSTFEPATLPRMP